MATKSTLPLVIGTLYYRAGEQSSQQWLRKIVEIDGDVVFYEHHTMDDDGLHQRDFGFGSCSKGRLRQWAGGVNDFAVTEKWREEHIRQQARLKSGVRDE